MKIIYYLDLARALAPRHPWILLARISRTKLLHRLAWCVGVWTPVNTPTAWVTVRGIPVRHVTAIVWPLGLVYSAKGSSRSRIRCWPWLIRAKPLGPSLREDAATYLQRLSEIEAELREADAMDDRLQGLIDDSRTYLVPLADPGDAEGGAA